MADTLADSAEEYRKARSPINAKLSKVFQPGFWFYSYHWHSLMCSCHWWDQLPRHELWLSGDGQAPLLQLLFFWGGATLKIMVSRSLTKDSSGILHSLIWHETLVIASLYKFPHLQGETHEIFENTSKSNTSFTPRKYKKHP